VEPVVARKMWRTLEPYHSLVYFTPRAAEAYGGLGLAPHAGYFASRAGAMGAVSAEVVAATFYNFSPHLVRSVIPHAWEVATPATVVETRYRVVDGALRETLGDDALRSPEMRAAADLARAAAEACRPEGRALYAAHAGLDWPAPDEPHMVLWHAVTLLREFRGDGHVTALMVAGLGGCEAMLTHAATDESLFLLDLLKATRGWTDEELDEARQHLRARGWLNEAGQPTPECLAGRERIEQMTDEAALAPWVVLGEERCAELRALVRVWSRAIVSSGAFAGGPF
jgi:hypothetical protein